MNQEVKEILNKLDNTEDIKRLKELNQILNNNQEYLTLMKEFEDNKNEYIKNNTYNEELILLRKKLFSIKELKEYLDIQSNLRILFTKINNEIFSIIN